MKIGDTVYFHITMMNDKEVMRGIHWGTYEFDMGSQIAVKVNGEIYPVPREDCADTAEAVKELSNEKVSKAIVSYKKRIALLLQSLRGDWVEHTDNIIIKNEAD